MTDDQLTHHLLTNYLRGALPEAATARVLDRSVLRFRGAVTRFSPGSEKYLPPLVPQSLGNVFFAGDYVAQGPGTHGAKGLSQEKAYVTGLQVRV